MKFSFVFFLCYSILSDSGLLGFDISFKRRHFHEDSKIKVAKYLVKQFPGKEFYIIKENYTLDGVEWLIQDMYRKHGQGMVKIVSYEKESSVGWMNSARESKSRDDTRMLLLLLKKESILEIFDTLRIQNLETAFTTWVAVVDVNIVGDLAGFLREGTQVVIAEKDGGETVKSIYSIVQSYVQMNNTIGFAHLGKVEVNLEGELIPYVSRNSLFPKWKAIYHDFNGRRLKVAIVDNYPFFELASLSEGEINAKRGIDYNILEILASKLNFSYQIMTPSDLKWGGPLGNGTVTGLIGAVYNRMAHLSIDEITITGVRETVVDFSNLYYMEPTTLVSSAPQRLSQSWQAFSPFSLELWIALIIITLLAGPVHYFFDRFYVGTKSYDLIRGLNEFSFEVFRVFANLNSYLKINSWSGRFIAISWAFFCFFFYAFYNTFLIASLTVPAMETPIDSLSDLLPMVKAGKKQLLLNEGSSNDQLFKLATAGIYKDLYDLLKPETGYIIDRDKVLIKVMKERGVFINAYLHTAIHATQLGREHFYIARQTFYPQSYGIVCPSGSAYRVQFDKILALLRESGLIVKWSDEFVSEVALQRTRESREATDEEFQKDKGPQPLSIQNMQSAFLVLIIGLAVSILGLAVEAIIAQYIH